MLQYREIPGTNILEFTVEGTLTADDVKAVVPKFVAAAEKHKSLRILKEVRNVGPIDKGAFSEQLGEVFQHMGDVTHAALVADKEWEAAVIQMGSVYPIQMRYFEPSKIDEAREWLKTAK